MAPPSLLILDVCGTLYAENTTVAFLKQLGATSIRMRLHWFVGASKAWLLRRLGASPGDCMRARVRMLKGLRQSWIQDEADRFVERLESSKPLFESLRRLDESLATGRETWLVSATLDEILRGIAKRHPGVHTLGSSLAFSDGRCLGTYRAFLLETGKLAGLAALVPLDRIAGAEFATDDLLADADLVSAVSNVVHVRMGRWE